jgi:hypothetical protein
MAEFGPFLRAMEAMEAEAQCQLLGMSFERSQLMLI